MGYIYKITNRVNDHFYIGQTVQDPQKRFNQHCWDAFHRGSSAVLHRAIRKYGAENFSWEVLEECPDAQLSERERHYIQSLNALYSSDGYNMTEGGNAGAPLQLDWDRLKELWEEGLDVPDIAQRMNLSTSQVQRGLQRQVPDYSPSKSRSRSSLKYHAKIEPYLRKAVDMYDIYGYYLRSFASLREAAKATDSTESGISKCLSGKAFSTQKMYRWAHAGQPLQDVALSGVKQVTCLTREGRYVCSFPSGGHAARWCSAKLCQTCTSNAIDSASSEGSHVSTAYGFKWSHSRSRMDLLDFVNTHSEWESILTQPPYSIRIKRDGDYVLLKYQMDSDFSLPIVRQCRGIILFREKSYYVVATQAFNRFFNYGEQFASEIDWKSARIQDKVDGSLIRVWNHQGCWHVSTNGVINAYEARVASISDTYVDSAETTFGDLFYNKFIEYKSFADLNPNYTYMFELVSPYTQVVVKYPKTDIYHIGTRDNIIGEEIDIDIGVKKPASYPLHSLDAVLKAAEALNHNDSNEINKEGFVVVDKYWHRVKIKSPLYLQSFYLKGNRLTFKRCLEIYMANEMDEYLSYFPEQREAFDTLQETITAVEDLMNRGWEWVSSTCNLENRKEFFFRIANTVWRNYYLKKIDKPDITAHQFLFGGYKYKLKNGEEKDTPPMIGLCDKLKNYVEKLDEKGRWSF